jgi:hypothetical protein
VVALWLAAAGGCMSETEVREVGSQSQALRFAESCGAHLLPGVGPQVEWAQERAYRRIRFAWDTYYSLPRSPEGDRFFGVGHDRESVMTAMDTVVGFLDVEDHRGEQQILYDCGACSNPTFVAETTFLSPMVVRLCEPFWSRSTDDWVYVFQHEYFHWALIADDMAYGNDAITLAQTNPELAVLNADNYALYVDAVN